MARRWPLHRRGPADGGRPARLESPRVRRSPRHRGLRRPHHRPSRLPQGPGRPDRAVRGGRREEAGSTAPELMVGAFQFGWPPPTLAPATARAGWPRRP